MQTLQTKTLTMDELTQEIEQNAKREQKAEEEKEKVKAKEQQALDEVTDTKIKLVPSPNFTDAASVGTFIPVNMADETITVLSQLNRKYDFIDFVKDKLGYRSRVKVAQCFASEQIDAIVMAINCFEKNSAFILGDMAGIGKGRVCAAAMRYAYQRGLIPIFVTHKPYLFSSIYRDFKDIEGIGIDKSGNPIKANPIVMHEDGLVYETDDDGEYAIDPLTGDKIVAFSALKSKQLDIFLRKEKERIESDDDWYTSDNYDKPRLGDGFNAVFLPYSTISQTKEGTIKQSFLETIAPKSIIIFDESHNAASANVESKILKRCTPLVESSEGCLFSSATYAKSPAVFNLYVIKTALRTAVPTLESITNALKVGGENVSEYIATGLVKEGQMIRRERSFSSCTKITEYVGTKRTEVAGRIIRTDDPNDFQKTFFNEAIGYFKELRDFSTTKDAKLAIKMAIERECQNKNYELVDPQSLKDIKYLLDRPVTQVPQPDKDVAKNDWIRKNRNKYILSYKEDSITRYKQTFRDNLFLAIKAKFCADLVLDCLNNEVKYKNNNGNEFMAPMKPVIAMKSTGNAIFNNLGLKLGDTLKNDFSEYLLFIYNKIFFGEFELRIVDNDVFLDETELKRAGINPKSKIKVERYNVLDTDFFDTDSGLDPAGNPTPRQQIIKIKNRLNVYNSQIPFSPIDYLKYRIESTLRKSIYYKSGTFEPKYGEAASTYYKMVEGTGREVMLEKMDYNDPNSLYVFKRNDRPRDISDVYKDFNNGRADVMLINVVASTGGSAHSSPKEGVDTRPRNMFIIQFELDVNTEVQKRGRVNRTGQLNNPTYTYVITQIPVEQRIYLMFRKKLRKLDANTSANQQASVESSEITDIDGESIEDIFNPYGFDVFIESFVNVDAFSDYKAIYDSLNTKKGKTSAQVGATQAAQAAAAQAAATAAAPATTTPTATTTPATTPAPTILQSNISGGEQDEENYEAFNSFTKELELYPVEFQKVFFDEMQILYKIKVRDLVAKGEYQLELIARDYKAVLRQSNLIQENSGTSTFSSSLFLSDYFTLNDRKIWSRDKVKQKIAEIADKQDPQDRHLNLIKDFEIESKREALATRKVYEQFNEPKRENFSSDNDFDTAWITYQKNVANMVNGINDRNTAYLKMLKTFTPEKPISYNGNLGIFLGIVLKDPKGRYKYAPAVVDFVFAFLSGYTTLRFNLTGPIAPGGGVLYGKNVKGSQIGELQEMIVQTQAYIDNFDAPNAQQYKDQVTAWKPNPFLRMVKRFYTGNILSGIVRANEEKAKGGPAWQLARFTNLDGSQTTAVQLMVDPRILEKTIPNAATLPLAVSSGSPRFIKYLEEMPISNDMNSEIDMFLSGPTKYLNGKTYTQYTLPIWNIPNPKLIVAEKYTARAVAIIKTQLEAKNIYYPIVNIMVFQNYVITKSVTNIIDPSGEYVKDIVPKPDGTKPDRWNYLYHNANLELNYKKYLTDEGRQKIKYAKIYVTDGNKTGWNFDYQDNGVAYNALVKRYSFNLLVQQDLDDLKKFLTYLSDEYQVSFNFKSSAAAYLNTPIFQDVSEEQLKKTAPKEKFEIGEYVYQFISKPSDNLITQIPEVKETRSGGAYGQIVLKLPLTPTQCFTFKLVPIYIPNIVYVKMALLVMSDIQKAEFLGELQKMASSATALEVGDYVEEFLDFSVPIEFFFGGEYSGMNKYEIGKVFQDYVLNKDISQMVESTEKVTKAPVIPKDKVTFEDAERFLMFLNP